MKIVIIPDSFKGSLSALEVSHIIGEELSKNIPGCECVLIPVADGGEGTLDCFEDILGGEVKECAVKGPNFTDVKAKYLLCGTTAVIESAKANGLPLANPKTAAGTTTYGVGQLILEAEKAGAERFVIGIGGSATNDGGCGMAAALGTKFFDEGGNEFIPVGKTLGKIARIEYGRKYDITVLCDVTNPLCGENGASYVYAPQKGASPEEVKMLDSGLYHLASILKNDGIDVADVPGAGAAGGMGAGLIAFCGAKLKRGIETILGMSRFDEAVTDADYIITGEGSLDSQSFSGKVIDGIISCSHGVPVIAVAGISEIENCRKYGLDAVFETNYKHLPFEQILPTAAEDLRACIKKVSDYIISK